MEKENIKLIIQIPALNEEKTLPKLLSEVPSSINGVSRIETLLIDDGSSDKSVEVARNRGVTHVIHFTSKKGLAKAFITGIDASLKLGADIIVNLDADGQYDPQEIPKLIKPIIEGKADMVVGDRSIDSLKHFSYFKRILQRLGSCVVRMASNTSIPDVTSGFRALSRDAALSINVISDFTYTIETLIQAGNQNIALSYVGVKARPVIRKSRLFQTITEYVGKSASTIIRIYTMYKPLKVFTSLASLIFLIGIIFFFRFLYLRFTAPHVRPIQHLIVSGVIILLSFQVFMIGLLADLISANRKLMENTLKRVKILELEKKKKLDA